MKVTLLNTSYHLSLLAELGKPATRQPRVSQLVAELFMSLFSAVADQELEQKKAAIKTRMGVWHGKIFKKNQKVVVTDVIRGGIEPSALFYHKLTQILNPRYVRQDHIMSQRIETGSEVKKTNLMGSKIGGSIQNALVFIPDPMGATGYSMKEVVEHYLKHYGRPKRFIAVNLVITPTYLKRLKTIRAPLHIYAARLDPRLTKNSFIVPGLGGMGEVINNTLK